MKRIFAILLAAMLLLCLCSCGGNVKTESPSAPMVMPSEPEYGDLNFSYDSSGASYDIEYDVSVAPAANIGGEKLIYRADLTVETTSFDSALASLDSLAAEFGGFIESSNVYANNSGWSSDSSVTRNAAYVLRVPSARFKEVVGRAGELGSVLNSSTNVENITPQFVDRTARKHSLEVQEERLLAMLENADSLEVMLEVEDRLSQVRYEIELIETTLRNWQQQVDYSIIQVYLKEVKVYSPTIDDDPTFGEEISKAFSDGWSGFVAAMCGLALFFARFLPGIILFAAAVTVVLVIVFKQRKKRRRMFMGGQFPGMPAGYMPVAPADPQPAPEQSNETK